MDIEDLKFPSKGNLDILALISDKELFKYWLGFSIFIQKPEDRTFTLPSKSELTKILVHRDMQKVKNGEMKLEEVREKFGMDGWLLERTYKQREKELKAEAKDWNHWGRKWRIKQAIEKAKKFRSTKRTGLLRG